MNYISAHSPKWRTKNSINLMVLFEGHEIEIPFIAHKDDTDEFNRELFEKASIGVFGPIDLARKDVSDRLTSMVFDKRDTLMLTGGAKVGEYWFHSDTHAKLQQLSLMIAGTNLPDNLMWKTMSGVKVTMTPTLAVQIYQSQMMQESIMFNYAEQLATQLQDADNPEDIDIENGWPEVYK